MRCLVPGPLKSRTNMLNKIYSVLLAILILGCNAQPKKVADIKEQKTIFKTMVYFEDSGHKPIASLRKEDMTAVLDNQTVPIQSFQSAETPISLFLAFDVSGIQDIGELRSSLIGMIKRLPVETEVSVLSSNLGHESTNAFSKDPAVVAQLIESYKPEGRSTFFVSILPLVRSTGRFLQRSNQRVAAIYVTTKDTFFTDDEIAKETEIIRHRIAQENEGVPIFGIYLGKEDDDQNKRSAVAHILEATGGKCFFATKPEELRGIVDQITNAFSGFYTVGMAVDAYLNDGNMHKIEINSKEAANKGKLTGNFYSPKKLSQPANDPIPEVKSN
jgi:hypothetical protein